MPLKDKKRKWKFAVDRGGTFTDVVALDPDGEFHTEKLLSSGPGYDDPCIEGIRRVMGLKAHTPLPAESISSIRFGTTAATNALLERKGGRTALFITKGFRDLLAIGYQSRPDIFALCIEKSAQLYTEVIEVDERIGPGGDLVKGIDLDGLEDEAVRIKDRVDAAAVVFMHSWKDPAHELKCGGVLERIGFKRVHLSHRAVNLIRIVTRGQSVMVDAYLSPVMALYLEGIKKYTGSIPIEFIESSGGLVSPGSFKGRGAVFSGPAGGVIATGAVARGSGAGGVIGFDMGGTSTDVSRYDGLLEKVYEQSVGGIELQGEALKIVTIASGGGSILWFDGRRMRVGPESAGARPGPACYGFGGPLTITDANLLTGRISKEFFPETFGPNGRSPIDPDVVRWEFKALAREINASIGTNGAVMTPEEAALGFLDIANEKMALAIKEISVSKGFDAREYALVSFGGAGPQHACAIAERLGMREILFHPLGGLMSAYGIGLARPAKRSSKTVLLEYNAESHMVLASILDGMLKETVPAEWSEGVLKRMEVDLRPLGADTCLTIEFTGYEATRALFEESYKRLFGFFLEKTLIEAVNLRLEVGKTGDYFPAYRPAAGPAGPRGGDVAPGPEKDLEPHSFRKVIYHGAELEAPVYVRDSLPRSFNVKGPAILVDEYSSLVIDPGFEAVPAGLAGPAGPACDGLVVVKRVSSEKACLQKRDEGQRAAAGEAGPDPVLLEVFNNLFMGVATEMGHVLKMTAHSVNIKERLDFSCAVFDAAGDLVASAQHIPVHLGAMSDIVRAIMEDKGASMLPGDVYVSNNPFRGGTHLPDVTVIEPVFSESGTVIFFVAARGHHADIGGKTPGSLPPVASHIDEEGVLLDGVLILRDGTFRERELRGILSAHKYPARNPDERISDIRAQMASCTRGVDELNAIIERYGLDTVSLYMGYIQENAEYAVKRALYGFLAGARHAVPEAGFEAGFADALDDSTPIKVKITIKGGKNPPETLSACIDFTGTGREHARDNLNAPLPVTRSAVLYVLKTLIEADIPLNSGCLKPVEIIVPEGSLLNPAYPAPVASGNVETSQRVVDVLLGALGIAAASQGTMNNLLFEVSGETPYYETIAGGSGAMDNCGGASGVQVHMTNTRITDPEVLEFRHPGVRLERFSLRRGSGGKGEFTGGDGVVREIRFLKPAEVSIISERRVRAPYGLNGGSSGKRGENLLKKADGETVRLAHRAFLHVKEGESIIIKTPGGGGYGKKAD